MVAITGAGASPVVRPQPEAAPAAADDAASVTLSKGDTVWALAAKDLGGKASNAQIAARVADYAKANPNHADLNKLAVGVKLTVPAKAHEAGWQGGGATAKPPAGTAEEAASQASASQAAAQAEREAGIKTLNNNVDALAANVAKMSPMTDTQKLGVADMAKDLLKRADALGVGKEVRESANGKQLVGILNDIQKGDVTRATEELSNKAIATQNGQRGPLTDSQKDDIAKQAAPLLAQAKELGLSTSATQRLESIVAESPKAQLAASLDKFDKAGPPIPQKWSPERLAEGGKLLEQLEAKAPELLKTPAGAMLQRVVESNAAPKPTANQAFRQSELKAQRAQELADEAAAAGGGMPPANQAFRQSELKAQRAQELADEAAAAGGGMPPANQAFRQSELKAQRAQELADAAAAAHAPAAAKPSVAAKPAVTSAARRAELSASLEKFDKSGPPIPQKWSPERLAEGNKLLSQLQKQAPELLKTEAGKSLARVVEFNQPRAAAKIDDETRARARAFVEEMTKPKA